MKIVVRLMAFTADDNRHRCALTSTNQCETRPDLEFSVGFDRRCRKGKERRAVISFQVEQSGTGTKERASDAFLRKKSETLSNARCLINQKPTLL